MKQKKEAFFKNFWSGIYNKQEKNIDINKNYDFNSQLEILKSFMSKKDRKNAFKIIDKLINKEKKNTFLLLEKADEKDKIEIKKRNQEKLNLLLNYEKDIKNNLKQEQQEKSLKVIDNKIIYVKNRIDFHSKNKKFKKALEFLNKLYEENKNDEKVIDFYNKEKAILDIMLAGKRSFLNNLFGNKNDQKETGLLKLSSVLGGDKSDKVNQIDNKQEKITTEENIKKEEINEVFEKEIENTPEIKEIKLGIKMDGVNNFSTDNIKEENKDQIQKSLEKLNDEKITDDIINNDTKNTGINIITKIEPKINESKLENIEDKDSSENSSLFGIINFNKDKKFDIERVVDFDGGLRAIKYFIKIKDWERAKVGVEEVRKKEEKAFNSLYDKIDLDQEKKKQKDLYNKKLAKIGKLADLLEKEERIYIKKQEIEKFKIKFNQIREKLDELMGMRKYYASMDLLNSFFEENNDSIEVIRFFNKWKNIIQKKIKKEDSKKEKEFSKNIRKEAETLIGENINLGNDDVDNNTNNNITRAKVSFFKKIFDRLNLYKKIKNKLKEKKLIDEVILLIDSQNEVDKMAKKSKLESMHKGLIKEIDNDRLLGYDLYAKILGKDKISGDTFGFIEDSSTYKFFLGDATGHGIQAGLIVTLLTRLFYKFAKENFLEKVIFEINNGLKQDLKSGNFITGIFFEVDKTNLDNMKYVGMGHEPILIYRKSTMKVEKLVAGGLASGIRLITSIDQVKNRNIKLYNGDIVFIYSDGIVESRNADNKMLGIDGLSYIIEKECLNFKSGKIIDLYNSIIEDVKLYKGGSANFYDDATIFIIKRNTDKDILDRNSIYLKDLSIKEGLSRKNIQELEGITKEEVEIKLQKIRKEKKLRLVIDNLEKLYITGEILKLKQEAIRYIKEGYIHKKINRYLKKAITNERQYKINLRSQKMKSKYIVLKELLKKGDYNTVIKEANEIIASDGNITI